MSIYYAFKKLGCHENYLLKFKSVNTHWKKTNAWCERYNRRQLAKEWQVGKVKRVS